MEIQGRITHVLDAVTGEGKNGTWQKQEIVIEIPGDYPKSVCIALWGDAINPSIMQVNNDVTCQIDIASREYNGRWYTEVKAWKIEGKPQAQQQAQTPPSIDVEEPEQDLPF